MLFNPIALRKAKTAYSFGLSECNRVKILSVADNFAIKIFRLIKLELQDMNFISVEFMDV